jgi:hypothetical protein
MKPSVDLLLHIGTEKTGTTSLQAWLNANSDAHRVRGVWYSESFGRPNNIAAAGHARGDCDVTAALDEELSRAHGLFVVSCEHCHSRLGDDHVARLRDFLAPRFDTIEVLCFLRPQADMFASRLSTVARSGKLFEGVYDLLMPSGDYLALYRRWTRRFDTIFLPFPRDVVRWFAGKYGLDATHERENTAVDWRAAAVAHNFGILPDWPVAEKLAPSRAQAIALQAKFEAGNRRLCEICPTVTMADLTPDFSRYPKTGNIGKAVAAITHSPGRFDPLEKAADPSGSVFTRAMALREDVQDGAILAEIEHSGPHL